MPSPRAGATTPTLSVEPPGPTTEPPVRTYFLGSGSIALPLVDALWRSADVELVGVATQPDRPAGRRRQPQPTPVAAFAAGNALPLLRLASVHTPEFLAGLRDSGVELVVVMSFGQLLKPSILDLPAHGCLNVHTSLLPRHRGAAPVAWAIAEGDEESGISFMRMDAGLDTGPVYEQVRVPVGPRETAAELEARLGRLAGDNVVPCIRRVCWEGLRPVPQPDEGVTHARKLRKQDGLVDWSLPATVVERRIRAFVPWPRAYFSLPQRRGTRRVQITAAEVVPAGAEAPPGLVLQADEQGWVVACGRDALALARVIPDGRPEMDAASFLRGARLPPGSSVAASDQTPGPVTVT